MPVERRAWDAHRPPAPELIETCVHCGFCLPTCPTYALWGEEMDSPRGRIALMQLGHEQPELSDEMVTHFDRCLGCMACVTACPSGVKYDLLIQETRPQVERLHSRSVADRLFRRLIFGIFTHPDRLRALLPLLALQRRLGVSRLAAGNGAAKRLRRLRAMVALAPDVRIAAGRRRLPERTPATGPAHGRVGFMQGCVQRVLFAGANLATLRVLSAEGWEVHAPLRPRCCGSLQQHTGYEPEAQALARETIAAFDDCDVVVVNAAGCGSGMKEYDHLLAEDPAWAERARSFTAKVRDVHELLAEHGPRAPRHPVPLRVAYHDPCHLAHAQGVREQPRAVLREIPGLVLLEPAEWELCCGSAGIYNLVEPEAAVELAARKVDNLLATGAEAIAVANPGCALQIDAELRRRGRRLPIRHPMELLSLSLHGGRE
jgi:glycolate oxidase iron-sulfur subunit